MKCKRDLFELFRFSVRIIVAFILSGLGTSNVMAQEERSEYVPFVEEGKAWYCGYFHSYDNIFPVTPEDLEGEGIDCIFTMRGDTQISRKDYKKVYCQYKEYYGDEEQHYYCAVREEDYRVFIVENGTTEEKLLYDFSHPIEPITLTYDNFKFARNGGKRRPYFLPGQQEYWIYKYSGDEIDYPNVFNVWIDGVGSPIGNPFVFKTSSLSLSEPLLGKELIVRTCMKGNQYIFAYYWMGTPIESASIESRKYIDNSQKESHLYDLQGRRLTGKPTKGLYIQNGRKVIY